MTIELTEKELKAIRSAIEDSYGEGQSDVQYETLLKLGFEKDHYMMVVHKERKDYDRGRE